MTILIIGLILFLGTHSIPINQSLRNNLTGSLGNSGYRGLFALSSLIGFILVIYGYGLARENSITIYNEVSFLRHIMLLLMIPAFILFIAANMPGKIRATLKHPMLIGTKTWAVAHLLVNGNLEDILLFGGFLAWAVLAMISVKRRERLNPVTQTSTPSVRYDIIAIVAGLALYIGMVFWGHEILIGKILIPQ